MLRSTLCYNSTICDLRTLRSNDTIGPAFSCYTNTSQKTLPYPYLQFLVFSQYYMTFGTFVDGVFEVIHAERNQTAAEITAEKKWDKVQYMHYITLPTQLYEAFTNTQR